MIGAGEALVAAAVAAVERVPGMGRVFDAPPLQASVPWALVEADLVTDWGCKTAAGREVRLAVSVTDDEGERPVRVRRLCAEVEGVVEGVSGVVDGWRVVSVRLVRSRVVRVKGGGWRGVVEFRGRVMAE